MPKGNEHQPKQETKLTAVSIFSNGLKIQTFLHLPVINGKVVLPRDTFNRICDDLEVKIGGTVSVG